MSRPRCGSSSKFSEPWLSETPASHIFLSCMREVNASNLKVGLVLQHEYTLLREIGHGGQASVWEVRDSRGRLLALKSTTQGNPERLRRESELLKRLRHPCIPTWHDFFLLRTGEPCLIFELIQGISLGEALESQDISISEHHKERLLLQLARVLDYLHQHRISHRDLQPGNVLLTPEFWNAPERLGHLKLIDFGIAAEEGNLRPLTLDSSPDFRTRGPSSPLRGPGSTPYMAPEMLDISREQRAERADPRIDVFALGVLGCVLFTGKHPVGVPLGHGLDEEVYRNAYKSARGRAATWPSEHPTGLLADVLLRCIPIERQERLRDGAEVLSRIQSALGETVTHDPVAEPPGTFSPSPTPPPVQITPRTPLVSPAPAQVSRSTRWRVGMAITSTLFLGGSLLATWTSLAPASPWSVVKPRPSAFSGAFSSATPRASVSASSSFSLSSGTSPTVPSVQSAGETPSPAPVYSAAVANETSGCSVKCGDWELCVRGQCSSVTRKTALTTCRVVLPAGHGGAPLFADHWLRKAPVRWLKNGSTLLSTRAQHERVLRVAAGDPEDRFLSRDLVECD